MNPFSTVSSPTTATSLTATSALRPRAFSLVELLAAVTIVGIMAFFAIPQVTRLRGDAEVNLAISRAESLNLAITSLIQVRGRTQVIVTDWPAATTNDARYTLLRPYLAYSETSITLFMPSGYTATLPASLEPLRKATLSSPSAVTGSNPSGTILY